MTDVWKLTGCPKDTFNKWLLRGNLKTEFPASSQGVPRVFTKQNALEMSFLTAVTNAGFDVGEAEPVVATLMSKYQKATLPKIILFNRRTGRQREIDADTLTLYDASNVVPDDLGTGEMVSEEAPPDSTMDDETKLAVAFTVIFPRSIAERVDKAFSK